MARLNQITVDHEGDRFIRVSCNNRHFLSATGLFQHCRSSQFHRGEWCERCLWLFVNGEARAAHIHHSSQHGFCSFCSRDLENKSELASHLINVHDYCNDCQFLCDDYTEHRIEEHHQCPQCGAEFQNDNNLRMHSQVHLPRSKECYGCTRTFPSDSAIFDHLEYKICPSGVTCHMLDTWAFECFQHRHYTNDWNDHYQYRCPSCNNNFRYLSALLRHAESRTCDASEERCLEKMKYYIMRKVGEYERSASSSESD